MLRIHSSNRFRSLSIVTVFLFTLLFLDVSLLRANNNVANKVNREEMELIGKSKLVLDTNIYDFHDIGPNSKNTAVFNLFNAGNSTLIISDVQKCCGAKTSLIKKEIHPGKSEVLSVQYNVGNETGLFKKTITLDTNDPNQQQFKLTIKGNVVPTLSWTPASFEIATYEENVICPEIKIKSLTETPFSIKRVITTSKYILCNCDPDYLAREIILRPEIAIESIIESNIQKAIIDIDLNHPDYKKISISIDLIPSLQINPRVIFIYNAKENESVHKSIVIQDNLGSNVSSQIESIASENGTKVEMISSAIVDKNCKLELKITPVAKKGSESLLKDQIVIKLKDGRTLNVPISIFYATQTLTSKAN